MPESLVARLRSHPDIVRFLIILTLVTAFAANLYGLSVGISIVIPHLFYIPIILVAFFYPRRGVLFAVALAAAYFLTVGFLRPGISTDIISAGGRCVVYIVIGAVVSYLSERVNARERDLSRAKEEWERTFDSIPDLIALIDRNHRILRVNRSMAQKLGTTPEKAVGLSCYEVVHRTGAPPSFCPHSRLLEDGRPHSSELHEDNLGGDFIVTTTPLRDEKGDIVGSVHIARDITRRKKAEDALREKTEELDRFFSVNLDMLCIADTEGRFHRLNLAWERTLGYTLDELMAHRFVDYVHPEDMKKTLDAMAALAEQKEVTGFVNRYRCRDGSYRWIEWRSYPYGKLIYAAARDITDRVRAEQAIFQANKKLNILSSITRHDILNKITALYAYLDITKEMSTDPAVCGNIDKEIETLKALQRQVEFTKYYQDIGVNAPEWQDIRTVFEKARSQLPLEGIGVLVDTGGYEIYTDPLIEKVFYNMMENSVRHGERVTEIRLETRKSDDGLHITYSDNGVGVPAEIKQKLFQRGFGKHTGLGLFLSREILSITGIRITENGEAGKGVRFEMVVPDGAYRTKNRAENAGR